MRWVSEIIAICIIMVSFNTATGEDISDLKKLISTNEDTHINFKDLAFFLATHNYNVIPKDGYAELNLNGKIYKLAPNGDKPGLCDIISLQ